MMRPLALQITADDFGFAAGHRRRRPFEAHRHQFYSASRQAKPRPCATTSSLGGRRCSAGPVRSNWAQPSRQAWRSGANACRRPKEGTGASSGQPSIGPHARGRSAGKPTRTPCRRMLASVMGWIGSSSLAIRPAKNIQGTKSSNHYRFRRAQIPGYGISRQSHDRCEQNASYLNFLHLARSISDLGKRRRPVLGGARGERVPSHPAPQSRWQASLPGTKVGRGGPRCLHS
jgi:hypothetical protein